MDYLQGFKDVFEGREFASFSDFKSCLDRYMKEYSVLYVLGSSKRSGNGRLKYDHMAFRCIKYKRRTSESRGLRRVYSRDTCCQSRFNVVRRNAVLVVSSFTLEHNHDITALLYDTHPRIRRLTGSEVNDSRHLFQYNTPTAELKQYAADIYGKYITTMDICNIRHRLKPPVIKNLPQILHHIEENGVLRVIRDDNNRCTHICFARREQVQLFRRFPDVVNVDATHGTNRHNLKLYQFLITDGMGHGRPVMYAFVRSEKYTSLRHLFETFREVMGEHISVRTFVMDKMAAQMRAARVVFGCDIMLCYFHVRDAVRKHTNSFRSRYLFHRMATCISSEEFNRDVSIIRRTDPSFMNYLLCNWLYIKPKWAIHAQSDVVHFGNRTNNRLENANGRLKKRTHPRDHLATAISKIWSHSEWLMREFEMQCTYGCDRREVVSVDVYVKNVLSRLTTFASQLVLKHLKGRAPLLHSKRLDELKLRVSHAGTEYTVNISDGTCECHFYKSMWLPCVHMLSVFKKHFYPYSTWLLTMTGFALGRFPIHRRWLAEYNLPKSSMFRREVTVAGSDAFQRDYKMLHHALAKLHDVNPRTGSRVFKAIIAFTHQSIETAKAALPHTDFPLLPSGNAKQPRWEKNVHMGVPCGYCGNSVIMNGYRCDKDQLLFHVECMNNADISHCPFCTGQLRPPSPVASTSNTVPPPTLKRKQRPCSPTLIIEDTSEDEFRVVPPRKQVRVKVLTNDYTDVTGNDQHTQHEEDFY